MDASIIKYSIKSRKTITIDSTNEHKITYCDDKEVNWVKKGKKNYYGYKMTISTDIKNNFITYCLAIGANIPDVTILPKTVKSDNIEKNYVILVDKGYPSRKNREYLKSN